MEEFVRAVRAVTSSKVKVSIGKVQKIEGNFCSVEREELPELLDVRLHSVIAEMENYFLIVPKIDSEVVVAEIENAPGESTIIQYSEIEEMTCKIQGLEFVIKEGKITIKNEQSNLKTILGDLFSQLDNAIITTPSGVGKFSPADKQKFQLLKDQTFNLLE